MKETFEGERLYLRVLLESDITEEYLGWFSDEKVTKFLEVKNLKKKDVVDYIRTGRETKIYYMYAVCLKNNNKHIGNIKVGPIYPKHKISDLVVVIGDKSYWGKGYATEAIKIGNRIAFEKYNLRKLWGDIYSGNIGSIKAYIKAGWVIEAKLKSHYLIDGKTFDAVIVSCFNPKYFDQNELENMPKFSL